MLVKQLQNKQAAKNTVNPSNQKKSKSICFLEKHPESAVQNTVKLSKHPCQNARQKRTGQNAAENTSKFLLSHQLYRYACHNGIARKCC